MPNENSKRTFIWATIFQLKENLSFLCKGLNEHQEEALVLLPRPLLGHIAPHQLVSFIREVGDETMPQKVETAFLKLLAFVDRELGIYVA